MRTLFRFICASAVAAGLLLVGWTSAFAQDYPSKPIRLVVPGPPGGGTDILARIVADGVFKLTGQMVIVENKPGASGMIAASAVLKAPPDGYTLFMAYSATLTTNQSLYKKLSYDPIKDFVPVAPFAQVPNLLVVNPSVPANSVAELIALIKSQPGKYNYAGSTPGSMSHLSMELFKQMTGTDIVYVPFNGDAPSMTALLGNQVQLMFANTVASLPLIKAGRLRALAAAPGKRTSILPDLPTVAESGLPGFETTLWYGVAAAAGTPGNVVDKLNDIIRQVQGLAETKARLATSGSEIFYATPTEFAAIIARDAEKLGRVVRETAIKVE